LDLVIADVMLPGGRSGTEFALELITAHPSVRVLFISGTPLDDWRATDLENMKRLPAGSCSLLFKPFFPNVLEARMRELLAGNAAPVAHSPAPSQMVGNPTPPRSRWMDKSL
jgi:DNA-binding response OmpR family regulator